MSCCFLNFLDSEKLSDKKLFLAIENCQRNDLNRCFLAGPVRFELTMDFSTPVFKTGAFNRSATDPQGFA